MKVEINLVRNRSFQWFENNGIYVKGYLINPDNRLFMDAQLTEYFSAAADFDSFKTLLQQAHGVFSVIIHRNDEPWWAVDMSGSFPIYYLHKIDENALYISDDARQLALDRECDLNETAASEFKDLGFVSEADTLYLDIKQTQAFHCVDCRMDEAYYSHEIIDIPTSTKAQLMDELELMINNIFYRLSGSLSSRQAVLPLSGGYDSRLIALMLSKLGHENVYAFTYGRKGNVEVENARRVAEQCGFPWEFIEYNDALIKDYITDPIYQNYIHFAANGRAMPFMQDYFAVKYLQDNKRIDDDAVFIPGHSADSIAGTRLKGYRPDDPNIELDAVVEELFNEHYRKLHHLIGSRANIYKEKIRQNLLDHHPESLAYSQYENWDFRERQSKFLTNSAAVFNYFGYPFRLPYWDKDFLEFFRKVPFELKKHKVLYKATLQERFFEPAGLNFETETQVSKKGWQIQQLKNWLRPFLPAALQQKFLAKHDVIFYKEITAYMEAEMQQYGWKYQKPTKSYNYTIVQWYLMKLNRFSGF